MTLREAVVEVRRGGVVESRHRVSAALVDARGSLHAWVGDPNLVTYFRSAAKPFQAMPLVADGVADAFGISDQELAICCASHSGEPRHVAAVRGLLERIGCGEDDLECGPHAPFHGPSADALQAEGRRPSRLHNNCSGKHTGMLAWARHHGEETRGYRRPDHPVQQRIRREILRWTGAGADRMETAIDGCGVVTFAQPLDGMARAFARWIDEAERRPGSAAAHVANAMAGNPYFVGGTGRFCTDLMEATGGRVTAKIGAEGLFCVADRRDRRGLALKVEDGAKRAVAPAVLEFLAQAEIVSPAELAILDAHRSGSVVNTLGEVVGEIRATYRVERSESEVADAEP